jgi:hypothetical protein|tara:strand:- start:22 stop:234 length:213 start_codon:yes stop_codon:yes gene_type:complete
MNIEDFRKLPMREFVKMYESAIKNLLLAQQVGNQQGINAYSSRCADLEEAKPSLVEFIEDQWAKTHKYQS